MKKFITALCFLATLCAPAVADSFIYGNNASSGSPYAFKIDKTTGAVVDTYTNLSGNNGRGSVVVGTTMYYTTAYNNAVYSYNLSTHTDNGVAFTVAGSSGLSTIAYDGTNFYIGDYSGTNHAYLYSPTGTLLKTISLPKCTGYCDGLEYFQMNGVDYLISNETDGGYGTANNYDLYDLNGKLVTANYIDTTGKSNGTTGIAFDGTDFYTSNIFSNSLNEWDETGAFVQTINLTGAGQSTPFSIEDLSADYAQVLPTANTPEPGTLLLVGSSVLGMVGALKRRLKK